MGSPITSGKILYAHMALSTTVIWAITLTRRLNNYNCEFYMRSQVAISELAETVSANIKYTEENREILDQKSITAFLSGSPLSPIWQSWLVKRGTNYLHTAIIYIKIISVT